MPGMKACQIDPRDAVSLVLNPVYRVYFWDSDGACDEWRLEDATWEDVAAWSSARLKGREATVWVEVPHPEGVVLHRITGPGKASA